MTTFMQEIHLSFGTVYVFRNHETGRLHASGFGIEADTLDELGAKCERAYYAPQPEPSNVEYQIQYAHACGYRD